MNDIAEENSVGQGYGACVRIREAVDRLVRRKRKYTAHDHGNGVIKVETRDEVICDTINNMQNAEWIAAAMNDHLPLLALRDAAHNLQRAVANGGSEIVISPEWRAFAVALQQVPQPTLVH